MPDLLMIFVVGVALLPFLVDCDFCREKKNSLVGLMEFLFNLGSVNYRIKLLLSIFAHFANNVLQ